MKPNEYQYIIVESFVPSDNKGRHGPIHIRPLPNQEPFESTLFVECSKRLSYDYPIGTKFRIKAKITSSAGGTQFVYSHYTWPFEVIEK
jgi:hypothetical protein